jgi:hypothetical protein
LKLNCLKVSVRVLALTKKRTTAYHPAANGQVERFNSTLVKIISRYVSANQKDWDTWLPASLHAYRTSVHSVTKKTPFEMLYARPNKLPLDLLKSDSADSDANSNAETFLSKARTRLQNAHATALQEQQKEQERQKENYDRYAGDLTFSIGDRVWLNNKKRKVGLNPKLQPKWLGPFTVIDQRGVDYVIKADDNHKHILVHQQRLKPCHTEKLPAPKVAKRPTTLAVGDLAQATEQLALNPDKRDQKLAN